MKKLERLFEECIRSYKYIIFIVFTLFMVGFYIGQLKQLGGSAFIGFFGVIIGFLITSGVNYYNSRLEREQKFGALTYMKQIETHQLAYKKLYDIKQQIYVDKNKLDKKAFEMQDFLAEHCLYLDPEIEDALRHAKNCATSHEDYLLSKPRENELIMRNWENIHQPFNMIRAKVKLPPVPIPKDPKG